MTTAYPLSWPTGWRRVADHARVPAKFSKKEKHSEHSWTTTRSLTLSEALRRLLDELSRLGATDHIISTNIVLRLDGLPRSGQAQPKDPGVAVYFKLQGKDRVLACDKWTKVEGNIAAIAAHIDAIRRQDRYGVGTLDQAFAGYAALPPPSESQRRPWRVVLGVSPETKDLLAVTAAYRNRARENHPDNGGTNDAMAEINHAYDEAKKEIGQ
jgi:hypothetical protein